MSPGPASWASPTVAGSPSETAAPLGSRASFVDRQVGQLKLPSEVPSNVVQWVTDLSDLKRLALFGWLAVSVNRGGFGVTATTAQSLLVKLAQMPLVEVDFGEEGFAVAEDVGECKGGFIGGDAEDATLAALNYFETGKHAPGESEFFVFLGELI